MLGIAGTGNLELQMCEYTYIKYYGLCGSQLKRLGKKVHACKPATPDPALAPRQLTRVTSLTLYHLMIGSGVPLATHARISESPRLTKIFSGGVFSSRGGAVTKTARDYERNWQKP